MLQQTTHTTDHPYNRSLLQQTTNTTDHCHNRPPIQQTTLTTDYCYTFTTVHPHKRQNIRKLVRGDPFFTVSCGNWSVIPRRLLTLWALPTGTQKLNADQSHVLLQHWFDFNSGTSAVFLLQWTPWWKTTRRSTKVVLKEKCSLLMDLPRLQYEGRGWEQVVQWFDRNKSSLKTWYVCC